MSASISNVPFIGMKPEGVKKTMFTASSTRDASISALVRASNIDFTNMEKMAIVSDDHLLSAIWRGYRSGEGKTTRAYFSNMAGYLSLIGLAVNLALVSLLIHMKGLDAGAYILVITCMALGSGFIIYSLIHPLKILFEFSRDGFANAQFLQKIAEASGNVWVLTSDVLFISSYSPGNKPKIRTVYLDAIGSVSLENDEDGTARIAIYNRDGSCISSMASAVSETYRSGMTIVENISGIAAQANTNRKSA